MAGTIVLNLTTLLYSASVSMESGLDGRNNACDVIANAYQNRAVSMESGLDGRNNRGTRTNSSMPRLSQWSPA